jgi:diguanylate cyclase (GGDEF)-like protein/PAS domain S-box-containing protein
MADQLGRRMFALGRPHLSRRGALAAAAALFVVITAARFAFSEPTNGIGALYLVPICVIAAELGAVAGVAAGTAATAIVFGWATLTGAHVSMMGDVWRLVTFAAIGGLVGGLVRQRDRLAAESARWFTMSNGLLCVADLEGNFTRVNPAWTETLGYSQRELLSRPATALVHPDDLERAIAWTEGLAERPSEDANFENRLQASDGSWHWLSWTARSDGRQIYAVAKDITVRKRAELVQQARLREAQAQAYADDLTGLANRRAWDAQVPREIARARRSGTPLSVAMLDLDGLKAINDAKGHQAGSNALKHAAAAWSGAVRESDMVARFGGDEFAVVMPDSTLEQALAAAERLRAAIGPGLTTSVGVAQWDREESAQALVERADSALYAAKRAGRDRVVGARPEEAAVTG